MNYITKVWEEGDNIFVKNDEGQVSGALNPGWDKGCSRCETFKDQIMHIQKERGWQESFKFALDNLISSDAGYVCWDCAFLEAESASGP